MSHGAVALSFEDPFTMDDWIEQWNATQAADCRGLNPWAIRRAGGRLGSSTRGWPRKKAPEDRSLKSQKDISESSPSWTAWPMPSPALRALTLHCASQGINVSKCDVPARRPVCAHWMFRAL